MSLFLLTLFALIPPAQEEKADDTPKLDEGILSAFEFRSVGPALMSGRIADLAIDPENPNIWYVAAGSGNLWKTTNAGTTFEPIFENYGSYSIGCVTLDPSNHNTIWVGSGEAVGGRHVGYGDGIYRSDDGGGSFRNMGLKETEHIAKIVVDPNNSDVIYVAAQGPLWSAGGERGLYKSEDGGENWFEILSAGEYTGVTDIVLDPRDAQVMYAAMHQRHRTVWALVNGGPESGIHKSIDGGATWEELEGGLPGKDMGKIGLAISPTNPDVVYATIELAGPSGGFWVSENAGVSWSKQSDYSGGGTGPHYYQEIFLDPHHADTLYQANVRLGRTEDGGKTWISVGNSNKHVDNHAVAFHPTDPNFLLVGCDGGLYVSYDRGDTYRYCSNLALTQFYKLDVDNDWPIYNIVGGTQDNSTQYGPSRTLNRQGIRNADWRIILGGDGHDNAIDPSNPDIIYGESQKGYIRRFDRRSGESVDIRPQPAVGEDNFRYNWDSPILISPHNPARIYHGSNRLHRSDDHGDSWTTISPDVSKDLDRLTLEIMGRVWSLDALWDLRAMSMYGNITSISESPVQANLLYLGTDDGRIQVSEDGGKNWRLVETIADVPETAFVNDIKADLFDADVVYAALDNHKVGDFKPYLVKSTDRGLTWTSITADLPDRHIVWRLVQDHVQANLFFLGTEHGIFVSLDGAESWMQMKGGLPNIPFRDLAIQQRENDLVGASFGRSFYILDNYAPLRELSDRLVEEDIHTFAVKTAQLFVASNVLGGRRGAQGDSYYTADNPEFGATFRYYLKEGLKSKASVRKKADKKAKKDGEDTVYPGWDVLRDEKNEEAPHMRLQIQNSAGDVIARLDASSGKGMQKVTWNLRSTQGGGRGPMVTAGNYNAQLIRFDDGVPSEWGEPQPFEVIDIVAPTLPAVDAAATFAWRTEVGDFQKVVSSHASLLSTALTDVTAMKDAVLKGSRAPLELAAELRAMELAIQNLRRGITGDDLRTKRGHEGTPSIQGRLGTARWGGFSGSHGPTQTMRDQVEIARSEFAKLQPAIQALLESKVPALKAKVDAAGVPWTSGRALPTIPR
ncbi:MAG: glycosyl hydrolase [Planctomycetota bacterium]|nr:MAG: glycosyl hydrolase [Planctomycetota bacterium]